MIVESIFCLLVVLVSCAAASDIADAVRSFFDK